MARRTYTDADKARVYVLLTANDGNVKRASREAGVPENTVRRWRDEWEQNGPPPLEEVEQAVSSFVDEATNLREMALEALRRKVELLLEDPKSVKVAEMTTLVGVLTDKIDRAAGLESGGKVDHYHHLPAPDEIRELMTAFVEGGQELAARRSAEIVEAELVEQPALPSGQ